MSINFKKAIVGLGLFIVIVWPLYELQGLFSAKNEKQDPHKMLYQVSLFQLEMLNSYLNEAVNAQHTEQLHALKQAAYTANYTHERFVLAVGSSKLVKLESVSEILQYVLRIQIGGQRELKSIERETLQEVSAGFREVYHIYEELFSSPDKIIAAQSKKLEQADQKIFKYLGGRLLE